MVCGGVIIIYHLNGGGVGVGAHDGGRSAVDGLYRRCCRQRSNGRVGKKTVFVTAT